MSDDTIFVQIASYRDPQLIPTLIDLIRQAARPDALRAVVCWQHTPSEKLDDFFSNGFKLRDVQSTDRYGIHRLSYGDAAIELIDVPYMEAQGVCWARNLIQQHYHGEKYTLQLDSHQRFVERWDDVLIEMLESLREKSPKPVLTAYPPAFDPNNDPASRVMSPTVMRSATLDRQGILRVSTIYVGESEYAHPVAGSFYSGAFVFADGALAVEVPHDPLYFHHGEDTSIPVRAFTYGYDIYHPNRIATWHFYGRSDQPKIWDDHTPDAKRNGAIELDWCDLNVRCWDRHRTLFGVDGAKSNGVDFGLYGFGTCRSLAQYERFAGVSFAHRAVHQALLEGHRPPIALEASEEEWLAALRRSHEIRIAAPESELGDWTAAAKGVLYVFDGEGAELHREALDATKLGTCIASGWFSFVCECLTGLRQIPVRYAFELSDSAGQSMKRLEKQVDVR